MKYVDTREALKNTRDSPSPSPGGGPHLTPESIAGGGAPTFNRQLTFCDCLTPAPRRSPFRRSMTMRIASNLRSLRSSTGHLKNAGRTWSNLTARVPVSSLR